MQQKKYTKFCAIILHYCTHKQTCECVDSLIRLTDQMQVVVVDNASNDGSGEWIRQKYNGVDNVDVLVLKTSEGFSYGNNYGYQFVRENYDVDFLLVFNNDVCVEQQSFCNKIEQIYQETAFDVLGPDIYVPGKRIHQNPQRLYKFELQDAVKEYERLQEVWNRMENGGGQLQSAYRTFMEFFRKFTALRKVWHFLKYSCLKRPDVQAVDVTKKRTNIQLHGSALIFSRNIMKQWEKLFFPETHFYYEEYILFERILREGKKTVYDPDVKVLHLHEFATKAANKRRGKKNGQVAVQNLIDSLKIYIDYLQSEK